MLDTRTHKRSILALTRARVVKVRAHLAFTPLGSELAAKANSLMTRLG